MMAAASRGNLQAICARDADGLRDIIGGVAPDNGLWGPREGKTLVPDDVPARLVVTGPVAADDAALIEGGWHASLSEDLVEQFQHRRPALSVRAGIVSGRWVLGGSGICETVSHSAVRMKMPVRAG